MKGRPVVMAVLVLAPAMIVAGCAAGPSPEPSGAAGGVALGALVPPGNGTLLQDDVTVSMTAGDIGLRVTPLEEWVIRLTAPDTYRRLSEVRARYEEDQATPQSYLLVSVFARGDDVAFRPEDLRLTSRSRSHRPVRIQAITPGWRTERLRVRRTESAVYAFEPVDLTTDVTVEFGTSSSDGWRQVLQRLRTELPKARARAGG